MEHWLKWVKESRLHSNQKSFFMFFVLHLTGDPSKGILKLTHLFPIHLLSTPCKHQKTEKFSDVFRG